MASNVIQFPLTTANDNTGDPTPPPNTGAPVLRVLTGGLADDDKAFARAYHTAMIAKAERDLIEARWLADHYLSPVGHYSPLWEQREVAFDAMLKAVINVALTPAVTKAQISMKKRAIGKVWLRAEGSMYDQFRERVALDEAHIARRAA